MGLMRYATVFLIGLVSGVVLSVVVLIKMLEARKREPIVSLNKTCSPTSLYDQSTSTKPLKEDFDVLKKIINFLDNFNSPMKTFAADLARVYAKQENLVDVEAKMKMILDNPALNRLEKESQEHLTELREHTKHVTAISNFMRDVGKSISTFSKDLARLSSVARNNMNKNMTNIERKEELIVNNWWQTLHFTMEYLSSDNDELARFLQDDLVTYSLQILEELNLVERRMTVDINRQFSGMKEVITAFNAKLKDRDASKDKVKAATEFGSTISADSYGKRLAKLRASEEALKVQTKQLYDKQRQFYSHLPQMSAEYHIAVLKSIVDTHSQMNKFTDGLEKNEDRARNVSRRMKAQLANAALSLVQMVREENKLSSGVMTSALSAAGTSDLDRTVLAATTGTDNPNNPMEPLFLKMGENGVQGYEAPLQQLLEKLLQQASPAQRGSSSSSSSGSTNASSEQPEQQQQRSQSQLDMSSEAAACIAATNPCIMPHLPEQFSSAIGGETCVWFNAFCGRAYRDAANSRYFYHWFCAKLGQMLNKGKRPEFVDEFRVSDVQFGELPPLILNVKWSPHFGGSMAQDPQAAAKQQKAKEDLEAARVEAAKLGKGANAEQIMFNATSETDEHDQYFAGCTADMVFRSGIKVDIETKIWINWPTEKYASVPITLHMELAEMSGRMRFGVTRRYSFLSFLEDPLTRISVRSEVGADKYKLKDIPQLSDFITKQMKSFISKKLVHPSSHKFRLIWPRTWWPEGTEDFFMPTPLSNPVEERLQKEKDAAAAAAAAAATTVSVSVDVAGTANSADTGSSAAQGTVGSMKFGDVHGDAPVTRTSAGTAGTTGPTSSSNSTYLGLKSKFSSWYNKSGSSGGGGVASNEGGGSQGQGQGQGQGGDNGQVLTALSNSEQASPAAKALPSAAKTQSNDAGYSDDKFDIDSSFLQPRNANLVEEDRSEMTFDDLLRESTTAAGETSVMMSDDASPSLVAAAETSPDRSSDRAVAASPQKHLIVNQQNSPSPDGARHSPVVARRSASSSTAADIITDNGTTSPSVTAAASGSKHIDVDDDGVFVIDRSPDSDDEEDEGADGEDGTATEAISPTNCGTIAGAAGNDTAQQQPTSSSGLVTGSRRASWKAGKEKVANKIAGFAARAKAAAKSSSSSSSSATASTGSTTSTSATGSASGESGPTA